MRNLGASGDAVQSAARAATRNQGEMKWEERDDELAHFQKSRMQKMLQRLRKTATAGASSSGVHGPANAR